MSSKFLNKSGILIAILLILVGVASAPLQFTYNREVIHLSGEIFGDNSEYSEAFTLLSRVLNAFIALLLLFLLKEVLNRRIYITKGIRLLIVSLGVFILFNYGFGSLLGSFPGLPKSPYLILTPVVLMFVALIKGVSSQLLINTFRYTAFVMLIGSIFMGVFLPGISYSMDSYEFGQGVAKRLIGLFNHPRQIGIYALLLLTVELYSEKKSWFHYVVILSCLIAMILSVSKTAIVLAVVILIWNFYHKSKLLLLTIAFVLSAALWYVLANSVIFSSWNASQNLETLTGRTYLWNLLVERWFDNLFFGNGPAFFSGAGDTGYAHAHNIIIQSLSDGGLFGLIGLSIYIFALVKLAIRNSKASKSLSVVLVILIFSFSMSEPVMRIDSFLDGSFFINVFLVLYLCALDRQRNDLLSEKNFNTHQYKQLKTNENSSLNNLP
jgi:O-antigen ligase